MRRCDCSVYPLSQPSKIADPSAVNNRSCVWLQPAPLSVWRCWARVSVPQKFNRTDTGAIVIIGVGWRKWGDAFDRFFAARALSWSSESSSGSGDAGVEQRINDLLERWVDGVEAGNSGAPGERVDDLG